MNKLLSLLGIAKRAGFILTGFEAVKGGIKTRRAVLVLVANDLSQRTQRELKRLCDQNGVSFARLNADSFSVTNALGTKTGTVAVCDKGFAKRAGELLGECNDASDFEEECNI